MLNLKRGAVIEELISSEEFCVEAVINSQFIINLLAEVAHLSNAQ